MMARHNKEDLSLSLVSVMKRVRETTAQLEQAWQEAATLARFEALLDAQGYHIGPKANTTEEKEPSGGVTIKFVVDNPFGPDLKDKESMPRHALAFLDIVEPSIDVKLQEHQYEEVSWSDLAYRTKPCDFMDDEEDWEEVGDGRWHSAVFHTEACYAKAYRYFYAHRDDADVNGRTRDIVFLPDSSEDDADADTDVGA